MADEGNANTFTYTLAGRDIVFYKTTSAQLLMLQRIVQRIQRQMHSVADEPEKVQELMLTLHNTAFEAAESRFTDPLDLIFVEQEVLRGNIDVEQIFAILSNGKYGASEPDDDADLAPVKRTRKAPAKKAATSRRVTR